MDPFHQHLDKCKQCEENPFELCAEGRRLIEQVARSLTNEALSDFPDHSRTRHFDFPISEVEIDEMLRDILSKEMN